jgi:hypothetical protein
MQLVVAVALEDFVPALALVGTLPPLAKAPPPSVDGCCACPGGALEQAMIGRNATRSNDETDVKEPPQTMRFKHDAENRSFPK